MDFRCALILLPLLMVSSSCSLIPKSRKGIDTNNVASTAPVQSVPKEQYDELFKKYQDLLEKSKTTVVVETPKIPETKIIEQKKPEIGSQTSMDPSELLNHIDEKVVDHKPTTEGVDALKEEAKKGPPVPPSMGVEQVNATDEVDEQINKIREAQNLIKVNKFDNALTILKELENSKEKQIVVRAKIMLGDLLFNQGEYDLASQVYEEVVKKYSFSGFVLKALSKLVVCSEKLKRPDVQARYYSLLHDFFEAG